MISGINHCEEWVQLIIPSCLLFCHSGKKILLQGFGSVQSKLSVHMRIIYSYLLASLCSTSWCTTHVQMTWIYWNSSSLPFTPISFLHPFILYSFPPLFSPASLLPFLNLSCLFLHLQSVTRVYSWREKDHSALLYWVPNADWLKSVELSAGMQLTNV